MKINIHILLHTVAVINKTRWGTRDPRTIPFSQNAHDTTKNLSLSLFLSPLPLSPSLISLSISFFVEICLQLIPQMFLRQDENSTNPNHRQCLLSEQSFFLLRSPCLHTQCEIQHFFYSKTHNHYHSSLR